MNISRAKRQRMGAAVLAMGLGAGLLAAGPASIGDQTDDTQAAAVEFDALTADSDAIAVATDAAGSPAELSDDNQIPSPAEPEAAKEGVLPLELEDDVDVDLEVAPEEVLEEATAPTLRHLADNVPVVPASATTWGDPAGTSSALVLFDASGPYRQLAEYYALGTGMLGTHNGTVTAMPVGDYVANLAGGYDAVLYVGSSYGEPLPRAFIDDVLTGDVPVVWSAFNIWQLAANDADREAFIARFGWDAATSYIDSDDDLLTVTYNGKTLTRSAYNDSGVLAPHIIDASAVEVLGTVQCTSEGVAKDCVPIAQTTGSEFPWAVYSSGLTYIGEIPLSYIDETDRYLAYADIIDRVTSKDGDAVTRTAAIRIEDVSPGTDYNELKVLIDYLVGAGVPFQIAVVPYYYDPSGVYNDGVPEYLSYSDSTDIRELLQYAQANGGTIIQHGTTHQYGTLLNPYSGVTGDDFEFYRSWCSAASTGGEAVYCTNDSWVQLIGALDADTNTSWSASRALAGRIELARQGLGNASIWETPHYAATETSYLGIGQVYSTRYERELFFPGMILAENRGNTGNFGQFFPYTVTDIYGTTMLPENLGNYEPEPYNNHAARFGADLVANAEKNLVMSDANASFFFHPGYPVEELQIAVEGIQGLGYTFVSADSLN